MKKLMIAAAVVCAAVAANAAALNWAFQTNGTQYAIPATTVSDGLKYNTTYDAGTTKLRNNTSWSGLYYTIVLTSQNDATKTDTLSGSLTFTTSGSVKVSNLTSSIVQDTDRGNKYDAFITIGGDVTDGKGKIFSAYATWNTVWTVQSTADVGLKVAPASSWTTTPEPTSGLLLLLGVAGLALRRKQK